MKYEQIKQIFINLESLKFNGIWFSGIDGDGEFKVWHANGKLYVHKYYKDNKLNGECKQWLDNGKLYIHRLYKDNKIIKDYLK